MNNNEINAKKFGLVFEEHREAIDAELLFEIFTLRFWKISEYQLDKMYISNWAHSSAISAAPELVGEELSQRNDKK